MNVARLEYSRMSLFELPKKSPLDDIKTPEAPPSKKVSPNMAFKAKMTPKAYLALLVPAAVMAESLIFARSAAVSFGPGDSSKWLYILGPLLIVGAIVWAVIRTLKFSLSQRIELDSKGIKVTAQGKDTLIPWASMIYRPASGFLRFATVAGKTDVVKIYEAFYPDFEELTLKIESMKR